MNKLYKIINLKKRFQSRDLLLNINLTINKTGIYGLKGASGSGKTTLLYILGLLDNDYEGQILFENQDLKKIKNKELFIANHIGFMFQSPIFLNEFSVDENLNINARKSELNKNTLLKHFSLYHKKSDLVKNLSGGERARLSLVRALINNPDIVFCDEPTGSLDDENAKILMDFLKQESKKRTIFIVSHNEHLLNDYCDVIFLLKNKKIKIEKHKNDVIIKKKHTLIKNNKLSIKFIYSYFKVQFKKKKVHTFLCVFSLFMSIFIVGFSLMLTHDVSESITKSFSMIINEDQIIVKNKNVEEKNEYISISEEDALKVIDESKYFYDYGYLYYADFESQFCDANYLSLLDGTSNLTFFDVGLREISETILLNDIPSSYKIYPNNDKNYLSNDEGILGLRKTDIRKICQSLNLNNMDEESLSNYLEIQPINFCFFFKNDSWGYFKEISFKMKAFFIVEDSICIAHSNKDFVKDFIENKMELPISLDLKRNEYYPWTIKRATYVKCDKLFFQEAIFEYLTSLYYEKFDFEVVRGNLNSTLLSSIFHKGKFIVTYAQVGKVSFNKINKYIADGYLFNIYPIGKFYEVEESAFVNGFTNSLFFSPSEAKLEEIEIYYNEIKENMDYLNLSQIYYGENVSYGNLITSAHKKGVKLSFNAKEIISGRTPESNDEIMISSSLCEKLFNSKDIINEKVYILMNDYYSNFENIFKKSYLNICGIYLSEEETIYQKPYWYPIFLVDKMNYSLNDIQINSFVCNSDYDVELLNEEIPEFEFINPLKSINESVENILDLIERVLAIFSILLVFSSIGIQFVVSQNIMKDVSKEIGLLKSLGISNISIFILYFTYNIIYFFIAYIISSFNVYLISKIITVIYFDLSFSFTIYTAPFYMMFLQGFIITIPISLIQTLISLKKEPSSLLKRYY